ncbi:MAG: PH domain-containing protein [Candidatus Micrarchaeota archaeon]|nr:PH domain-containing protein [Candidatus Micrarchaeota archaeon]
MFELDREEKILYHGKPSSRVLIYWLFVPSIFIAFVILAPFYTLNFMFTLSGYYSSLIITDIDSIIKKIEKEGSDLEMSELLGFSFNDMVVFLSYFFAIWMAVFLYHVALRSTYHYYITNERVIFKGGILLKTIRSIPHWKITDVTLFQNILERILGIYRIGFQTAGTEKAIPEIIFSGLTDPREPYRISMEVIKSSRQNSEEISPVRSPDSFDTSAMAEATAESDRSCRSTDLLSGNLPGQ